jgi:hypothetical protein
LTEDIFDPAARVGEENIVIMGYNETSSTNAHEEYI